MKMKWKVISKGSYLRLLIFVTVLWLLIQVLLHYGYGVDSRTADQIVQEQTSFWHISKICASLGFALLLVSFLSNSSSTDSIDLYKNSDKTFEFAHHPIILFIKIVVIIISIVLIILGEVFTPEIEMNILDEVLSNRTTLDIIKDNFVLVICSIILVGILFQTMKSIISTLQNKNDTFRISPETLFWSDNNSGEVEISINNIHSIHKIMGDTEHNGEVVGLTIKLISNQEKKVDFEKMSLVSQGKKIAEVLENLHSDLVKNQEEDE